jgi:hypothetical protein
MRQTSIDCYNQIKAEGLLSKRRLEVYEAILKSAPCSSGEAFSKMLTSSNVISQSRARFTELRELGVIYEIGVKKCSITNRNVIEWDLTDEIPADTEKAKTKSKKTKVREVLNLIETLGKQLTEQEKVELRKIYHLIKKI